MLANGGQSRSMRLLPFNAATRPERPCSPGTSVPAHGTRPVSATTGNALATWIRANGTCPFHGQAMQPGACRWLLKMAPTKIFLTLKY
jgi:hypothetical protein